MSAFKLFIPITKVDAAQRLVYGVVTAEAEDRVGEICDYESTRPFYQQWSDEIAKSTGGKSLGNVRAMHSQVAAGKITALNFNDADKQIEVCAKIVDDGEWTKVREGVYTGFSQGGTYVRRWTDGKGLQRYTAQPQEISLVDLPCLPQARFEMIKADGSRELRSFVKSYDTISRLADIMSQLEDLQNDTKFDPSGNMGTANLVSQLQGLLGQAFAILQQLVGQESSEYTSDSDMSSSYAPSTKAVSLRAASALSKVGARNNAEDQSRIQNMHDTSVELGATCYSQKHAAAGGLEKRFETIAAKLDDLLVRVKNIESQPLPLPLAGRVRAVSKGEDGMDEPDRDDEVTETNREAAALRAIKKAQRQGRNYFTR